MAYEHEIDADGCKGCGLCVTACPKDVLEISDEINVKGYFPAFQARPEDCIFCAICCTMCPDVAITIREIEAEAAAQNLTEDENG
jgi:2-oxoglutarate ferredoxin oxidoreductase subunit delta